MNGLSGKARKCVCKSLRGVNFPSEKMDLYLYAEDQGANGKALEYLYNLPAGEYENMAEVMEAVDELLEEFVTTA